MPYRVEVNKDNCLSSGKCVADAPQLFRFDADQISEVIPGATPPSDQEVLEIARNCPALAIELYDGDELVDLG